MATAGHTPRGRGFRSGLGYFHSTNSYYDQTRAEGCGGREFVDLWDTGGPARRLNATGYEETIFADRAVSVIEAHDPSTPLFLYYALHTSCVGYGRKGPGGSLLQPPPKQWEAFAFIDDPDRRANHAMVAYMDEAVGRVVAALQRKGLWNQTLLLWSSDNGGAVHLGGGSNVYPLRGGYENNVSAAHSDAVDCTRRTGRCRSGVWEV